MNFLRKKDSAEVVELRNMNALLRGEVHRLQAQNNLLFDRLMAGDFKSYKNGEMLSQELPRREEEKSYDPDSISGRVIWGDK